MMCWTGPEGGGNRAQDIRKWVQLVLKLLPEPSSNSICPECLLSSRDLSPTSLILSCLEQLGPTDGLQGLSSLSCTSKHTLWAFTCDAHGYLRTGPPGGVWNFPLLATSPEDLRLHIFPQGLTHCNSLPSPSCRTSLSNQWQ